MILTCSYEELQALASGAELVMTDPAPSSGSAVATEVLPELSRIGTRLSSVASIDTLSDLKTVRGAVHAICERLHDRLDEAVLALHPAHEDAVAVYFDYAHTLAVLGRLDEMAAKMKAMIRLMTDGDPDDPEFGDMRFP